MVDGRPFTKIAHIGIAVQDLDEAVSLWRDKLGLEPEAVTEMEDRGLKIAFFPVGESLIELIAPLHEKSEVSRFLERKGPGVHHICLGVNDIKERLKTYRDRGLRPTRDEPALGAEGFPVVFLHPKETGGVLLELLEETASS